jgi:hypothetical protein
MSNGKGGSGLVTACVAFLVACMGFMNWRADSGLEGYYNNFARAAYQNVLVEKWNPLVDLAHKPGVRDEEIKLHLEHELVPAANAWIEKASKITPPALARDFHLRFEQKLEMLESDARKMVAALDQRDKAQYDTFTKHLAVTVSSLEKEMADFKAELEKERGMRSEEAGK